MKAYCAINVLLLPNAFAEGGYILSPCAMVFALIFQGMTAKILTDVALEQKIYSYPLIMEKAMGKKGLIIARVCLSLAHF